ncbi:response regulator [Sorangium sp. So ce448]|uniref:response regulator n=1 Tax=Sorangium sp. So ce448 TaxID=3133314 RepID=UPI003F63D51F
MEQNRHVAVTAGLSGRRALIVDDDPVTLQIVERLLQRRGVNVRTAAKSFGLLNLIVDYRPSFVILDVKMPGLDGPTLVTLVRSDPEIASTVILLHSALDVEQLELKAQQCGADGHISKSLGLVHFERSLMRWLRR